MAYHQNPYNYITQSTAIGMAPLPTAPGGNNTEFQFNNGGIFDGTPYLTFQAGDIQIRNDDSSSTLLMPTGAASTGTGVKWAFTSTTVNSVNLVGNGDGISFLNNAGGYDEIQKTQHKFITFIPSGASNILLGTIPGSFDIYFNEATNQPYILPLINSAVQGFTRGRIRLNTTTNDYTYPELKIGITSSALSLGVPYYLTENGVTDPSIQLDFQISDLNIQFSVSANLISLPTKWVNLSIIHWGTNFIVSNIQYVIEPNL